MSSTSEGTRENATKLLELARKRFGKLNKADEKLFKAVANGELADYSDKSEENNKPAKADTWGPSRLLKSDRIQWLCNDKEASDLITHLGIHVKGAYINGKLDLQFAIITFPLYFEASVIPRGIDLHHAEIRVMNLRRTHTGPIFASGLEVKSDLFLRDGFSAAGEVNLVGATVGGHLGCSGSQFINPTGYALNADGLRAEGSVFLDYGFNAEGEVRLIGAIIGGDLGCLNGRFANIGAMALSGDGLKVRGSVFMSYGFKAYGTVKLADATIGGQINCIRGQFSGPFSLVLDRTKVERDVFLQNGFMSKGEVRLFGTTITGGLECENSQFSNPDGCALRGHSLKIGGDLYLRNGFKAEGEVNLEGAKIKGNFHCENGRFINERAKSLFANGLRVGGNVLMCKGFKTSGEVSLVSATISGFFYWMGLDSTKDVKLDLRSARIGTLRDEEKSWPEKGKLFLHGLVYDEIHNTAPRDAESRIEWLQRQGDFYPQPYEQLAEVFRKGGQDEDARKILIWKNEDKAKLTKLTTWSEIIWYRVLGPMIGYGYRPLNALWGVLLFVVLGWILFGTGYRGGLVTPQSDSAYVKGDKGITIPGDKRKLSEVYPRFNFLVYSIDTFVPLIDLHQSKYWLPNANRGYELLNVKGLVIHTGGLLRLYLWIHIVMGWALTTLLVVGLTGLVRT